MFKTRVVTGFLLLLILGSAGCVATGPSDFPVQRNFQWFSYVAGEDIRLACGPGAPDKWRFVFNGIYDEQVRMYDMDADRGPGGGAILQARVKGTGELLDFLPLDPFGPWRGPFSQAYLDEQRKIELDRAVFADGLRSRTRPGTRLRSDNFYWVASACRGGAFHQRAWQEREDDLSRLTFVPVLLGFDRTPVPYNTPRRLYLGPFGNEGGGQLNPTSHFMLTVGGDGLILP